MTGKKAKMTMPKEKEKKKKKEKSDRSDDKNKLMSHLIRD